MRPSEYDAGKIEQATSKGRPVARLARPGAISAAHAVNHLVVTSSSAGLDVTSFDPRGNKVSATKLGRSTLALMDNAIFGSQVQTARIVLPDEDTAGDLITASASAAPRVAQAVALSLRLPINFYVNVVARALDRKYYAPRGTDTSTVEGWAHAFGVTAPSLPQLTMTLFKTAVKHRWFDGYFTGGDLSAHDFEYETLKYLTGGRSLTGDIYGMRNASNLMTWWDAATRFDLVGRRRAQMDGSVMRVRAIGNGSFVALGPITTRTDKNLVPLPDEQPDDVTALGAAYNLTVLRVEADQGGEITITGWVKGRGTVVPDREYLLTEKPYFGRGTALDKTQNKWLAGTTAALTPAWRDVPPAVSLAGAPTEERGGSVPDKRTP